MVGNGSVTIGLLGMPPIEEKRLRAAFEYSAGRHTSYAKNDLDSPPDILMVNADQPQSLIEWRSYRNRLLEQKLEDPPSVLVSKQREFKTKHYQVRRPLIASRIISILDQVVSKELNIDDEVAILGNEDNDNSESVTTQGNNDSTALVVDDSLPVRMQMNAALKPFTSRVDLAETGEEAFDLVNKNNYDIIFLDIILPGIDGYEVCKAIKEGKAKDTPVILLTGNSSPADRIKGNLSGCDTYLIKPISQMVFKEIIIDQYLNNHSLPRKAAS
jgi:two-component system cell cycle response regulator